MFLCNNFGGQFAERARAISVLNGFDGQTLAATRRSSDCTCVTLLDRLLSRSGEKEKHLRGDERGGGGFGGGGPLTSFHPSVCPLRVPAVRYAIKRQRSRVITTPSPPCQGGALRLSNGREVTICGASWDEKGGEVWGGDPRVSGLFLELKRWNTDCWVE